MKYSALEIFCYMIITMAPLPLNTIMRYVEIDRSGFMYFFSLTTVLVLFGVGVLGVAFTLLHNFRIELNDRN